MRLIGLRLRNFRQHADTEIRFRTGLTGIIGPNGAGKSTLLEAVAWAVYGSEAARGTNDTLRFSRAGARSRVEVELRFALAGHEYQVVRTLHNAEVFLDGGASPVASTLGGATRYLQSRLGMSRREFFNTYFTGQKELQFLATMGPAERGRFLSTVLGYERLRRAQDLVRSRRNELRHEVEGLRSGLQDLDEILAARRGAEEEVRQAEAALAAAQTERAEASERRAELAPRWDGVQAARDRHRELSHAVETAEGERESARRDMQRVEAELERISAAEAELAELRAQLAPLPALSEEYERMSRLARLSERRKALAEQVAEAEAELARSAERLERLEQAPELLERYGEELERLRAGHRQAEAELDERKTSWVRDRQDAETKLLQFRDRAAELQEQVRQIREAGPAGKCPTCERPLGSDFERVLGELEDQWRNVVQDGKWWKSRREQLEEKPAEVAALETRVAELDRQTEEKSRKQTRCEEAVKELKQLRGEREKRAARIAEQRAELEEIPAGYDRAAHEAVERQLKALRLLETRAARLEGAAGRREALEGERAAVRLREAAAAGRGAEAAAALEALGFAEAVFASLREAFDAASRRAHQADLLAERLAGDLRAAREKALAAARDEEEYRERMREIQARETDFRHHDELDGAFSELRSELNAQVRPELSEIASLFLTQLTDGRYTALEIDHAYNILVLDEGEEKPVISGGEEDVANLVLRLSLSQMIAERAGYPLSLLILDEVFGSLDVARRDNVVHLLRRLEDRFEQVILITHIEGIRENLDQILHVTFDERTGSSVVREESFLGTDEPIPEGMAAD